MNSSEPDIESFLADLGMIFEGGGLPHIAGRVMAWLLVSPEPEQTAEQISAATGASKASVSTMLRLLIDKGVVERIRVVGSRLEHHRIRSDAWISMAERRMRNITDVREAAERGLQRMRKTPAARQARLREVVDVYRFLEEEFQKTLARFSRRHGKGRSTSWRT